MKKVVLIGGGHGLSNMVKGFKNNKDIDLTEYNLIPMIAEMQSRGSFL